MDSAIQELKERIVRDVFTSAKDTFIVSKRGTESTWLFDFRRIMMDPVVQERLGELFWERYQVPGPVQLGCLEAAGIPLATALALLGHQQGRRATSFFVRKSRKKYGLQQQVEGTLTDAPVVLVDDLMNSGESFERQIAILEALGKRVTHVFVILRFRDLSFYTYLKERGIAIIELFTLDDFAGELGTRLLPLRTAVPTPRPFSVSWYFKSENPNYFYVVPKSAPAIDATQLYVGSDAGYFWALSQATGEVVWKHKVGLHRKGKHLFSSPLVVGETVYFGAYDGNVYALDTKTGRRRWVFMEADWVGSSPCYVARYNTVVIGLEFGLWKKQGGVVALNAATGEKVWEVTLTDYVHATPTYVAKRNLIVIGSNEGVVYALNAKTGAVAWTYAAAAPLKAAPSVSADGTRVFIGDHNGFVYALDTKTGTCHWSFRTGEAVYSTPAIAEGTVVVSSLDKRVYALDAQTGQQRWVFETSGRVFASPRIIGQRVYVGSNDGRLYVLALADGSELGLFQGTERITNAIAYNGETKQLFVPTFANEVLCLTEQPGA